MKLDIICPGCKSRFHETTKLYAEDTTPNGSMFRLKEPYRTSWRWSSFPEQSHVTLGGLECPSCGASYLVHGRVLTSAQQFKSTSSPPKPQIHKPKRGRPPKKKTMPANNNQNQDGDGMVADLF